MNDRTELLESAFDAVPEGFAVLGAENDVVLWNRTAEALTGYAGMELLTRPVPDGLEPLLAGGARVVELRPGSGSPAVRGARVRVLHKLGHELPVMSRVLVLRDGLGARIGTAVIFHPAESLDALPHGVTGDDGDVAASQADLQDRLNQKFEDFQRGGAPFGVLWIGVDQAHELRKTHGGGACRAMLAKVQRALAVGLRPSDEMGRWGEDEFLVIAHERSADVLAAHAQVLANLAKTADFRWWGDRVPVTVSIGAAQAERRGDDGLTLARLLECARKAMAASMREGGNRVQSAEGEAGCLPS